MFFEIDLKMVVTLFILLEFILQTDFKILTKWTLYTIMTLWTKESMDTLDHTDTFDNTFLRKFTHYYDYSLLFVISFSRVKHHLHTVTYSK